MRAGSIIVNVLVKVSNSSTFLNNSDSLCYSRKCSTFNLIIFITHVLIVLFWKSSDKLPFR